MDYHQGGGKKLADLKHMAIEGIALLGFHFEEKLDYVRVGFNLSNVESNQKEHVFSN